MMLVLVVIVFTAGLASGEAANASSSPTMESSFPWSENLVKLEQMSIQNVTKEQEEVLMRSNIPPDMWPYVNITAVVERERKRNATDGGVITDEDVSEDDEHPQPNTVHNDGKKTTITISTEAGLKLYQHWTDQAVSGLMAALATNKLKSVGKAEKLAHKQCNKEAKTVKQHARCVVELLDAEEKYQRWLQKSQEKAKIIGRIRSFRKRGGREAHKLQYMDEIKKREQFVRIAGGGQTPSLGRRSKGITTSSNTEHYPSENNWLGAFRMRAKRFVRGPQIMSVEPISRKHYDLLSGHMESPLTKVANILLRDVRKMKNKKGQDFKSWKNVIDEIRQEGKRIRKKQKDEDVINRRLSIFRHELRKQRFDSNAFKKMNVFGDEDDEVQVEKLMKRARNQENEVTDEEKLMMAPIEILRDAVKIGMAMSGKNVSSFDEKNIKMISPRFFSVLPEEEKDETVKLISPSLFALHNEGHGIEKETSLAKTLSLFGKNDNEAWLNLIVEAAGVSDALDSMKKDLFTTESRRRDDPFRGPKGEPLWFSKENVTEMFGEKERIKVELFEQLQKTFSEKQLALMNRTGYFTMNNEQLDIVYGEQSPFHDPETRKRLSNVSAIDMPAAINNMVRGLASETMEFKAQRRRSIVLSPLVLGSIILEPAIASQPVILSPVLLTPVVLSPAIFGAVILSPWVFVPVILAPRLLSPVILSPVMFSPIVLSPLAFDPLILCPGVGTPFILSPLVLSPFILSPVAINPLILSPFALTPFIGVPHTLSPLILSPFILSPIIYSPPFISAFVLSPHALSPIIESTGTHFTSILSPSWLS